MKWLRDGYGDVLTSSLAVRDCFRDRSDRSHGDVDPKEWTVQVDRAKPAQHELQNPLRFASLAPESSARARNSLAVPTLQQAVTGRSSLLYVGNDHDTSFLNRRSVVSSQAVPLDPDRPIRSRERDFLDSTQHTRIQTQKGDDGFVVADSQPSPEQSSKNDSLLSCSHGFVLIISRIRGFLWNPTKSVSISLKRWSNRQYWRAD